MQTIVTLVSGASWPNNYSNYNCLSFNPASKLSIYGGQSVPQGNTHKRMFSHLLLCETLWPLLVFPPNGELASRLLSFPNQTL